MQGPVAREAVSRHVGSTRGPLSGGSATLAPPDAEVLRWPGAVGLPVPAEAPHVEAGALVRTGSARIGYWGLAGLWVLVNVLFWPWWLQGERAGEWWLFAPATLALGYVFTALPSIYWFFVGRARRPPERTAPRGMRVAMITPCVPSHESFDVIARQMAALAHVRYPHDSWVLDEGDDPEVRAIAEMWGVRYFTRKDVEKWNRPGPPFQAKTKAGNVNAWLDHIADEGIEYDAFVQLDIDHIPSPDYLDRTLGHLRDPSVAWVQAPSVAGNLDSWVARGHAEQDVILQGPLQMGFYGHTRTPFIIGSHTTYRMGPIREIGGYQPTRAEDHLDTVVLAAHGYRGVYTPEVIARGDGPETLATYLGQQFAWAYSMIGIFFERTPRLLRHYDPRQAFQFLMAQSWYTMWSGACAVLWALPIIAVLTGHVIAEISVAEFAIAGGAVLLTSFLMWWTSRDLFQPEGVTLSWRGLLLETARWPIVLSAVVNVVLRVKRPYMITPKGRPPGALPPGGRLFGPFLALAWVGLAAIGVFLAQGGSSPAAGHLALVYLNVVVLLGLVATTVALEHRDARPHVGTAHALRGRLGTLLVLTLTVAAATAAFAATWAPMTEALG